MGSRVADILLGWIHVHAMFGFDDDRPPDDNEWEHILDADRLANEAEAEAAGLGLLDDEQPQISLPLAASSSSAGADDAPVTPLRKRCPKVTVHSHEKRIAPEARDETIERKRLRFKQACSIQPAPRVPQGVIIDGKGVRAHPLFVRYFKTDANLRRLASKRMSQQKFRLVKTLLERESVEIYGETLTYGGDHDEAVAQVEHKFFLGIARDVSKDAMDRGYALSQLALHERDNDLGCSDTNQNSHNQECAERAGDVHWRMRPGGYQLRLGAKPRPVAEQPRSRRRGEIPHSAVHARRRCSCLIAIA